MAANIERYEKDLDQLVHLGGNLQNAMGYTIDAKQFRAVTEKTFGKEKVDEFIRKLPSFNDSYEIWFSESLALIRQLLPDRVPHFVTLYERPKNRKELTYTTYTIQDFIEGLQRGDGSVKIDAAYSKFAQQLSMLRACKARFASSLFEIRQLVQADLFDSEIDASRELLKHGFCRAAGAIAGVVLEKHLRQVCDDHKITVAKKHPGINDLNQFLKDGSVISIPQWRHITLLGDIRNLCDHNKDKEPTKEQVTDLLDGTDKVLKTIS